MPEKPPKKRVLLVDDQKMITSTLRLILQGEGFEVAAFTEPMLALDKVESFAPDLLLADVTMPQLSGIALARRVLAAYPDCKVIFLSGRPDSTELIAEITEKGTFPFEILVKPFHPSGLIERVRKALGVIKATTADK